MYSSTSDQIGSNMSLATTSSPQRPPTIGEIELYLISTAFGTTWTFGLVSNIIALMALCKMKQTSLNVIIIGLCCSDILSLLASPFVITQLLYSAIGKDYPWNSVICKTMNPILTVTPAVTVYHVLALSIWRMYAIHRSHRASEVMTLKRAKQTTITIWMVGVIVVAPFPAYSLTVRYSSYSRKMICFYRAHQKVMYDIYNTVDAVVMIFVPVALIVILCVAIGLSLLVRKSRRQKLSGNHQLRKEEKNALLQLALIVASFLFGYLPKVCYLALTILRVDQSIRMHTINFLTSRFLLNLVESVNPIVYNLGSKSIRESTKQTVRGIICICRPSTPNNSRKKQQPRAAEEIEMGNTVGVKQGSVPRL